MACDVFISYKSETIDIVNAIVHSLEAEGIRCWYAPRDLERTYTESYYSDAINKVIHETKVVIAIVCDEMLNSGWCRNEMDLALDTGKIVIPYSIRKVTISNGLTMRMRGHHWIDAFPEPEKKFSLLVNNIKGILNSINTSDSPSTEPLYVLNDDSDFDYEEGEMLYSAKEYNDAVLSLSVSAEKGNKKAAMLISKIFYHLPPEYEVSDTIWELMEAQARRGFSHANFALHTKYYSESSKFLMSYDYVRKAAADKTNHYAFLRLGIHYGWGIGVKPNHVLAKMWYEKAIEAGSVEAIAYLGQEYESGSDKIKKEEGKAFSLYMQGAELGDTRAMSRLGDCYRDGIGTDKDFDKAVGWYQKMIEKGDNKGYTQIGYAYWIEKQDQGEAIAYFKKAAVFDEGDAFDGLSRIYWIEENYEEAYKWAKAGHQVKNARATELLAHWYTVGDNRDYLKVDYEKAWKLYADSYSWSGRPDVAVELARLFFVHGYKPEDVSLDYILNILDIAVRNRQESAIDLLVSIYSGDYPASGVQRNEKKVFEYTLLGAEGGSTDYMKAVAGLYEKGAGVVSNLFKSGDWLGKAIQEGDRSALSRMIQLCKEHREVAENLGKWILEAAKQGMKEYYMDAASSLSREDPAAAAAYLQEIDSPVAYATLSRYYAEGTGVEPSLSIALNYKDRAFKAASLNEREDVARLCRSVIDPEKMAAIEKAASVPEDAFREYVRDCYFPYFNDNELGSLDSSASALGDYEWKEITSARTELLRAVANLKDSYAEICTEHELPIQHVLSVTENMPPSEYFTRLAPNICKMFLQLKHAGLLEKYSLGFSDEKLLNVLERDDSDQARQLFLISVVEVRIDLEIYEVEMFRFFKRCMNQDCKALAESAEPRDGNPVTEQELKMLLASAELKKSLETAQVTTTVFDRLPDDFINDQMPDEE